MIPSRFLVMVTHKHTKTTFRQPFQIDALAPRMGIILSPEQERDAVTP
jgi:hypothetical protein